MKSLRIFYALIPSVLILLTLILIPEKRTTPPTVLSIPPTPYALAADTLTEQALSAAANGIYVGQVVNPPILAQDFLAPSNHQEITQLSDTQGTWRVIFFGYMHCPDFCPLTLADYRQVKRHLGTAANDVTFMYISVDSARDTSDKMKVYLDNFDSEFIGFSPNDETLRRIQPDYDFYYERRLYEGSQSVYTIDHSTRSYVLDRNGVLRTSFAYDTPPQQMANALLWYLEHE